MDIDESIKIMINEIFAILADNKPTVYLFGSVALNDFKLGWSDIDILVLTDSEITEQQATTLVGLRQTLTERYPNNPYFRLFEGGMLSSDAFLQVKKKERYTGERVGRESPTAIRWTVLAWQNCTTAASYCMEKTFAVK